MKFSTEVISCKWQEHSSRWQIHLQRTSSNGKITDFIDECDILLHATGVLNNFKWPKIKGIEKFKGKILHTARWPEDYQKEEWQNETVAVIGSGASSIQTVPTMQVMASKIPMVD
jgi:cation diffusion facilitator CzcD-associated flavoprotein CzcO